MVRFLFFDQIKNRNQVSLLSPKTLSGAKAVLLDKASINSDESATQKWKLVLLLEASRYIIHRSYQRFGGNYINWDKSLQKVRSFLISNDDSSANGFDKAIKFIRGIKKVAISAFKIEGSLELDRQTEDGSALSGDIDLMFPMLAEAASIVEPDLIYLLVDQVDDLWDSSKEGRDLIIGLLRAAKEVNDRLGFLKTIVFLRSDIFGYLRFRNSDHFRSQTEYLEWDSEGLKKLIALRIHKSTNLGGDLNELWHSVFPPMMSGTDSFAFLVQYTLMRPRDLIQLCNICKDTALNEGSSLISPMHVFRAIEKYSIWKTEDLVTEYYVQFPFLEKILSGVFYASPSHEITREKFEQLLGSYRDDLIAQYGSRYFEPMDVLLQSLYGIGFLGVVHQKKVLYEVLGDKVLIPHANLFHVHRAFRNGLRIPDPDLDFSRVLQETRNFEAMKQGAAIEHTETVYGDGAIAQGSGAKAAGKGGILISGSVSGDVVIDNGKNVANNDEK